ncbi:MAG: zinc ribbon domain-containing protein [Pseudomonadota bacterium]
MPIYDFQCTSCGHKLELLRKISDSSVAVCPSCNQETFSKMLSAPSFQLSGSGWYATDFKDKTSSKSAKQTTSEAKGETDAPAACKTGCACH